MNDDNKPSKKLQVVAFFSIWLLIGFFSRDLFHHPNSDFDYLLKNVGTQLISLLVAGICIQFFTKNILWVAIIITWMIYLTLAIR